jgi:hypothetical protein
MKGQKSLSFLQTNLRKLTMSEIEVNTIGIETTEIADPIEQIFIGECSSVSERSTLTYAFGRSVEDHSLHLRIVKNSGGGMACTAWASASDIDTVVRGETELTSKAFLVLHPSKSVNTGGFLLGVVRDLGLICVNPNNSRYHSHVPGSDAQSVMLARMEQAKLQPTVRSGKSKPSREAVA